MTYTMRNQDLCYLYRYRKNYYVEYPIDMIQVQIIKNNRWLIMRRKLSEMEIEELDLQEYGQMSYEQVAETVGTEMSRSYR